MQTYAWKTADTRKRALQNAGQNRNVTRLFAKQNKIPKGHGTSRKRVRM